MVVFMSDNGLWLIFNDYGGLVGFLCDGKGVMWEGGMWELILVWWLGKILVGLVNFLFGCIIDLMVMFFVFNGCVFFED